MISPFAFLEDPTDSPLLIDAATERIWTQVEVAEAVESTADALRTGRRELVFNLCRIDLASIIGFLSAVRAGHAVAQLEASVPEELTQALVERYRPAWVLRPGTGHMPDMEPGPEQGRADPPPADDLAVLLSTSGTTGSPKLVRLSRLNIVSHAHHLGQYLGIDERERAIQSLPLTFSYGLSVLYTHLAARASVILPSQPIMRPEFWSEASRWGATSFAGVPYSYSILQRTGFLRDAMPDTMHTLTQSGGRMPPENIVELWELMRARGGRFFAMYGQTESTSRMSYVPPDALPEKAHTVGIAIPGGRVTIQPPGQDETTEPGVEGEVIFRGPNVMLGYAEGREALARGDDLGGTLRTGDLGKLDEDGFLQLTGRMKRIAKIYGLRVNLDEIEAAAGPHGPVAAIDGGDRVVLWRVSDGQVTADDLRRELAGRFGLKSRVFAVRDVDDLPLNSRGKVDYRALASRLEG